jgi:putative nucleotidyltransferase with HDIG domain
VKKADCKINEELVNALLQIDFSSYFHSTRVEKLAVQIGRELKLSSEELSLLGMGALLHDIGKFNIPESILEKKTPLTPAEWAIIEEHPVHGYRFANAIGMDDAICRIILHHHLWANGAGGYPASEGVVPCLLTQITTVADVVDAMTHERPYRPPLSIADCIEHLEAYAGTKYNAEVVQVAKQILNKLRTIRRELCL